MESISLIFVITVFTAGIFSFFSPCVLPVLPVYIGILTSDKVDTGGFSIAKYLKVLLFLAGLSAAFFIMGFGAGALGAVVNNSVFFLICGLVIIVLGLHQAEVIQIPFLNRQKTLSAGYKPKEGLLSSFLLGFLFSFGWTPCVGPVLGAVLGISSNQGGALTGGLLLLVYSLGLGIPFAVLALGAKFFLSRVKKIYRFMPIIKTVGGILIILMGLWMVLNQVKTLTAGKNAPESAMVEITDNSVDFTLFDMNGEAVTLSDYKGKAVYIKFWATWCPSCLAGLESFKSLAAEYDSSEDAVVLSVVAPGINGEMDKDDFTSWAKGQGIDFTVLFDETNELNQGLSIRGYPASVIIDSKGEIFKKSTGDVPHETIKADLVAAKMS